MFRSGLHRLVYERQGMLGEKVCERRLLEGAEEMETDDWWIDWIDVDFPKYGPITQKMVEETKRLSAKFRGNVRISTGRIYTDDEYKRYRRKVADTPLP